MRISVKEEKGKVGLREWEIGNGIYHEQEKKWVIRGGGGNDGFEVLMRRTKASSFSKKLHFFYCML